MAMAKQQQFHSEQRLQMQLTEAQKSAKKKPGHAGAFVGSFMSAPPGSGSGSGYGGGGGFAGGSGDLNHHSKMPSSPLQNAGALVMHNGGRPPPPQPSERKLL